MKGKIEVYKSFGCEDQELIMEGNNTVVDGAGELLADIMTAHASLSSIPNLSSILDASNYTIQAMSFGTDSSGYRKHGHEWGTTVPNKVSNQSLYYTQPTRIITISTQSDLTVSSYDPSFAGNILPSYVTPIQTKLEENALPSGEGESQNPNLLSYTVNPYASPAGLSVNSSSMGSPVPGTTTEDVSGAFWYTSRLGSASSVLATNPFGGLSSIELSTTTDAASPPLNYTPYIRSVSSTLTDDYGYSSRGKYFKDGYNSVYSVYIKRPDNGLVPSSFMLNIYDEKNPDSSNTIKFQYLTVAGEGSGAPTYRTGDAAGVSHTIEDVGDDWYRISVVAAGFGTGGASTNDGDDIEVWTYVGDTAYVDYADLAGTRLWIYAPQLEQHRIATGVSATSYQAVSGDIPPVGDGIPLVSLASGITDKGHNLNMIPYASAVSASLGHTSSLGGVFGCYPEGSSTGGTQFFVVSSDANIPPVSAPLLVSSIYQGTYYSLFNEASSMDVSGFLNFVGSSTTDVYLAAGFSGLTVSAETTLAIHASTTGEIAYKTVIGSGDLGTANLYGGIYNIGLWSMDLCA